MTRAQHDLMITLALILRGQSAPDDQRDIDRKLNALEAEDVERLPLAEQQARQSA